MTATLAIRPFTDSDRHALEALWLAVFPDDPARNAPRAMIDNKLPVISSEAKRDVGKRPSHPGADIAPCPS